ncbi:MAG: cytochrome C oxidase subunit IV [Acidiferrobacter sp.]
MDMSHLSFVIPIGADTPMFFWMTGFIGFPITFLAIYFWWLLKEVGKEDRLRVLNRTTDEKTQY